MIPKVYTVDVIYTVKVQASCAYEAEQKAIRTTKEECVTPVHTEAEVKDEQTI